MNASLIAIYLRPDVSMELGFLEELVLGGGFQLSHPQTGDITLIDDDGDFRLTGRAALAKRMSQCQDTRLQFWESKWNNEYPRDLYCRVRFKSKAVVIELGELPRDLEPLLKGVWARSREGLDSNHIIGVTVDRHGVTEDHADWDAFFTEGCAYNGPCPDILCVSKTQEQQLPANCRSHRREVLRHHVILLSEEAGVIVEGRS